MANWLSRIIEKISQKRRTQFLKRNPCGVYTDRNGKRWFNPDYRTGTLPGTIRKIM